MSIRHQSTDVAPDQAPVADIMGSRETVYTGARSSVSVPVETEWVASGGSFGVVFAGLLAVLLSAWAGIVPYVGPTFGFSADGTSSWTWNDAHTYGALVPGAVGVIFALTILAGARRTVGAQPTGALAGAGFVVFLCGAWLAVFPVVWPVITAPYFHAAAPSLTLAHWLAYASGPGILLVAIGAYVMGRSRSAAVLSRRSVVA